MGKSFFRKAVAAVLSGLLMASLFAGCGSAPKETASTAGGEKDPKEYKGTINVWSFTDELKKNKVIEEFNKIYPNIKVNLTVIPMDNNAYSTKLSAVLNSGSGAPDVFTSEVSMVNRFVNTDFYENLSQAPYNGEEIAKGMTPYVVELSRNQGDKGIRAFTWQACPGGIFYKRSLAKQYLGTDDPDEISKKLATWDSLIATGKELDSKSGGKVKLLAGYGEAWNIALGSRQHAWVEGDKLVVDENMMKFVDYAKQIRDAGIDAKLAQWSAPWSAAMSGPVNDVNVFGYVLPTWGLKYVLQNNAPKTSGDWGLAKAPAAYYWGGTWIGMYSKSPNKEIAWQFVKFMASKQFAAWNMKEYGDFPSNLEVIKDATAGDSGKAAFAGNQNVAKTYSEILPSVTSKLVTKYDETINTKFQSNLDLYVTGKKSKDEFLQQFKADVKTAFPELNVD